MSTRKLVIVLIIFATALIIGFVFQVDRERKLKNSKTTIARVEKVDEYLYRKMGAKISFTLNGKSIVTDIGCDCRDLKIGDSVLIKYAIENPKLAVLKDKYYMQKYKSKK
jgi:hypothetical protein